MLHALCKWNDVHTSYTIRALRQRALSVWIQFSSNLYIPIRCFVRCGRQENHFAEDSVECVCPLSMCVFLCLKSEFCSCISLSLPLSVFLFPSVDSYSNSLFPHMCRFVNNMFIGLIRYRFISFEWKFSMPYIFESRTAHQPSTISLSFSSDALRFISRWKCKCRQENLWNIFICFLILKSLFIFFLI